jgi:hypothetical protein
LFDIPLVSGVVIADGVLHNDSHFERHGTSFTSYMLYSHLMLSPEFIIMMPLHLQNGASKLKSVGRNVKIKNIKELDALRRSN